MNKVMHVNNIAGQSILTVFDDSGKPVSATMADVLAVMIGNTIAEGKGWPDDAVYKVEYRCRTWPMGWEKETSTKFFDSEVELNEWTANWKEWARCEDNEVNIRVEEWDLGPSFKCEYHFS